MQTITEFLTQRGLRMHPNKSFIVSVYAGFDYLDRHYQRKNSMVAYAETGLVYRANYTGRTTATS